MSNVAGRRRKRRAYDQTLYVNRQHEINLVLDKCKAGPGNETIPRPVVCFWGGRGIGKSWLLGELASRLKRKDPPKTAGDTVRARLDFDPNVSGQSLWKTDGLDRVGLLRELWRQLAAQVNEEAKIRPGPRPICQATKLLDADQIVRRMAEQDLLYMGRAAHEYLMQQRAQAAPDLQQAIDRLWQRILAQD